MANCYVWKGVGADGRTYTFAACATNPNWKLAQLQPSGGSGWYAPYDGNTQLIHWWSTAGEIALVQGAEALAAAQTGGGGNLGGCGGCLNNPPPPSASKYDCINGACLPNTTYSTPGLYQSLSECEVVCGTGCSGKCISNADWATIEGLAGQLKNKNCS